MDSCSVDGCTSPPKARGLCKVHYQRWLRGDTSITAGPSARGQRSDHCSVPGCGGKPVAKGLCGRHYQRQQRTGDPGTADARYQARQGLECSIRDCAAPVYAKGWCVRHYENDRLRGNPRATGIGRGHKPYPLKWEGAICSVDGCERPVRHSGLCSMHGERLYRLGSPGQAAPLKAPRGSGTTNANGYREITVDGRKTLEHRVVMEQILGRPLLSHENVHHRNGKRDDNRPSNLELWVSTQPSGQEIHDLIEWAEHIITHYGPAAERLDEFRKKRTTKST